MTSVRFHYDHHFIFSSAAPSWPRARPHLLLVPVSSPISSRASNAFGHLSSTFSRCRSRFGALPPASNVVASVFFLLLSCSCRASVLQPFLGWLSGHRFQSGRQVTPAPACPVLSDSWSTYTAGGVQVSSHGRGKQYNRQKSFNLTSSMSQFLKKLDSFANLSPRVLRFEPFGQSSPVLCQYSFGSHHGTSQGPHVFPRQFPQMVSNLNTW